MGERSAILPVPGAHLALWQIGSDHGRTLVVLHGGPGESHDVLRPHLDALATEDRRVVYYDQRGSGRSALEPGTAHADLAGHVADLELVRRHLDVPQIDLLGFSWGATLAIAYARLHREHVRKLVLVSPPSAGADEGSAQRMKLAAERPEVRRVLETLERSAVHDADRARLRFATRIAAVLFDPELVTRLTPVDVDEGARTAAERSMATFDLAEALGAVRGLPTLVTAGRQDPVCGESAARLAATLEARCVLFDRCGHAPFAEVTSSFVEHVRAFLDDDA